MLKTIRAAALFVPLAFLPIGLVAGCVDSGRTAAVQTIPFTDATVTSADGRTFSVSWNAPNVQTVRLYAGTDPTHIGRDHLVGQGGATGMLTVALPTAPRWYFELAPDRGGSLVVADRSLHLATAPNFRDAGGYRTADGRWVRMGLLYRSDQLDLLSPSDLRNVHDIGIHLVCDLRTDDERTHAPDRVPEGAVSLIADVAGGSNMSASLAGLFSNPALRQQVLGNGGGERFLTDANRNFVASPAAAAAYKIMFERLADPRMLPGVFHCTAGKDRTGWAQAVFLSIMGVPRDVIMRDYLMSNMYLQAKNQRMLDAMKSAPDRDLIRPLFDARPEYLQSAFDEIDRRYGSFDRYVHDGIGLDDATLNVLRNEFLAG